MHLPKNNLRPSRSSRRGGLTQIIFELALITLVALLYFAYFLSARPLNTPPDLSLGGLHPANRFGGLEYERLAGILLPIKTGLETYGQIPTWNPYLNVGTPLLNNAFNYLFNPFASVPVLLFGGVQGSKIALMVGMLLAGWNMWALMKAVGAGGLARVAAGAFYMLSGALAAKYYIGHFQLGLSLTWPPLVFAGLWWTLYSTDRRAPVLMAAAFALLFFSGNIYYSLHVLLCCGFIFLLHMLRRDDGRWRVQWARLRRVLVGGGLALGFAAVQFLPIWTTRDFVVHARVALDGSGQFDPSLESHYELTQAVVNYVYPWSQWHIFDDRSPWYQRVVVDYAYIGPGVFLFVAGIGFARRERRGRYRLAVYAALPLALLMMVWGAGQTDILLWLYTNIELLSEFRYLGRAHAIGALWWIVLAGIGIDMLWRWISDVDAPRSFSRRRLTGLLLLAGIAWAWFLVYSLLDNSTRLQLALNIFPLYITLTERVFANYQQAADVLWALALLALVLDWLAALLRQAAQRPRRRALAALPRLTAVHLLRLGLVALVLMTLTDVMRANSPLIRFGEPVNDFTPFYVTAHTLDNDYPFPAIQEPFSPSTFDSYTHQVRNWLLNEGWTPRPLPDVTPGDSSLRDVAGWGIVSNQYSGVAYELALAFVQSHEHELIECDPTPPAVPTAGPCGMPDELAAALYRLPEALPYAFIAAEDALLDAADSITAANVLRVTALTHEQDTITIQAQTPPGDSDHRYYLVVQETHFPGWQAWIDDQPSATMTFKRFTGLLLPPGAHTVTLRFQPPGLAAGVLFSVLSVIAAGFYLRGQPNRKTSAPSPPAPSPTQVGKEDVSSSPHPGDQRESLWEGRGTLSRGEGQNL